jgi:hypothetical protein
MGGLTAGFGMGPGDPPLHGRARAGRSPRGPPRAAAPCAGPAPWRLHGVPDSRTPRHGTDVGEELGLLVPLA